jgi:hypothetical protein
MTEIFLFDKTKVNTEIYFNPQSNEEIEDIKILLETNPNLIVRH